MNEENIKRMESTLARAYKEDHYKESLERMIKDKHGVLQTIAEAVSSLFN